MVGNFVTPVGKVRDDALLILCMKQCHMSSWVEMCYVFARTVRMKDMSLSCLESGLTQKTAGLMGSGLMTQSGHGRISTFPVLSHLGT